MQETSQIHLGLVLATFFLLANQTKAQSVLNSEADFFPALSEFSSYAIIYPEIHHGIDKRKLLSTLDEKFGLHASHITLTYYHRGQQVYVDLQLNYHLLPQGHFLRYQNSKKSSDYTVKNYTSTNAQLCHYQGTIRGKPHTQVAISTCMGGINGLIINGTDTYFIQSSANGSLQDRHFLFCNSNKLNNKNIARNNNSTFDERANESEFDPLLRHKRSFDDKNVIRGPYNAIGRASYVELVIVVDYGIYKSFDGDFKRIHNYCKDLTNIVNALYVPLNIYVALIGVVIWNQSNEIAFSSNSYVTLQNFLAYRREKLSHDHPNDHAQLLTKEQFDGGVVGKALLKMICTYEMSGSLISQHSPLTAVVAVTMAHEMGHSFGMDHDLTPDCNCLDEKCIMSDMSTAVVPVHWSSCSIDQLNYAFSYGVNYCLRNKPTKLFSSANCGNGFVEPGEQCDCGLPSYCKSVCCDPNTCMLYANATCATGECCDLSTCQQRAAGTLCRSTQNECDLPEYCTGVSEYCPLDVFKRDTEMCADGNAYCYQGDCHTHAKQCRVLWGPTGKSIEQCYKDNVQGNRGGNCGYSRSDNTFFKCAAEDVNCGLLHCHTLAEKPVIGNKWLLANRYQSVFKNTAVHCFKVMVDLGLQDIDLGLTPNGAKCGDNKMCLNQKCLTIAQVRAKGSVRSCPDNCSGNGFCNSNGNCHCRIGFGGMKCSMPGPGGSVDSGPVSEAKVNDDDVDYRCYLYIIFCCILPLLIIIGCAIYIIYRKYRYFKRRPSVEDKSMQLN